MSITPPLYLIIGVHLGSFPFILKVSIANKSAYDVGEFLLCNLYINKSNDINLTPNI